MRFTVLTALLFASSTLATPLGIRDIGAVNDVKVITQAVKNVSQGLDKLRGALNVIARAKLSAITAPEEQEIIHHAGEVTKAMNSGAIESEFKLDAHSFARSPKVRKNRVVWLPSPPSLKALDT